MKMRFGKSLVAVRRIKMYVPLDRIQGLRILIVAPNEALGDWYDELMEEGESDVTYLQGTRKKRLKILNEFKHKWYLFNKEGHIALPEVGNRMFCFKCNGKGKIFDPRIDRKKKCFTCYGTGTIRMDEPKFVWDSVVIDESPCIKTPTARITKFYTQNFTDVAHRWILSGYPNPEGNLDFHQQFMFLDNGRTLSNNYWTFRKYMYKENVFKWTPKKGTEEFIAKRVGERAFIQTREDLGIPDKKIFKTRRSRLPDKLYKIYKELELTFMLDYKESNYENDTIFSVVKYSWMHQLCGGFLPRDKDEGTEPELIWDGKFKEIVSLLKGELKGEQVNIWFNYTHELEFMKHYLSKHNISSEAIYGKVKSKDRRPIIESHRRNDFRALLLQIECGKYSLNLSHVRTSIYYSNTWKSESRVQSLERTEDIESKESLFIIDMLVEDTVDELIVFALRNKQNRAFTLLHLAKLIKRRQEDGKGINN